MNEDMDIPLRGSITSSPGNIGNNQQTYHILNHHKIWWTHPNKGTIEENLCNNHLVDVMDSLRMLGISCDGEDQSETPTVCLRCVYDGYDITTWMEQWN
jgi:hypothetical protein